jgi:hypothetical protein
MQKTFCTGPKAGRFSPSILLSVLFFTLVLVLTACPNPSDSESSENDITGVSLKTGSLSNLGEQKYLSPVDVNIDQENGTVAIVVPKGNALDALILEAQVSEGASVSPAAGGDLTSRYMNYPDEELIVTAENGDAKNWTVSVQEDPSPVQNISVEILGNYQIRFLFAYPNYKELNGSSTPDLTPYPLYDAELERYTPVLLSYFVDDNDLEAGASSITYYNTLVVSAGGFSGREWKIDGKTAPTHEGGDTDAILTIHAQDWTLEEPHTVTFIGTKNNAKGNELKYSGEFTFKVVERPVAAQ